MVYLKVERKRCEQKKILFGDSNFLYGMSQERIRFMPFSPSFRSTSILYNFPMIARFLEETSYAWYPRRDFLLVALPQDFPFNMSFLHTTVQSIPETDRNQIRLHFSVDR